MTRSHRSRRTRRVSRLLVVAGVVGALAVIAVVVRGGRSLLHAAGGATAAPQAQPPRRLRPVRPATIAGPLPGALLIADRGNNRMLLVDAHRRVLWRFP